MRSRHHSRAKVFTVQFSEWICVLVNDSTVAVLIHRLRSRFALLVGSLRECYLNSQPGGSETSCSTSNGLLDLLCRDRLPPAVSCVGPESISPVAAAPADPL